MEGTSFRLNDDDTYPVKLELAAQAEAIRTFRRIMETPLVKASNFKIGFFAIEMHSTINCFYGSVYLDVRASIYFLVLKLR